MTNNHESHTTNDIREEAMVNYFRKNIDRKAFILTESFPYMFIGIIKDVIEDMVVLNVKTTSIPALEKRSWTVRIHSIDVFYIEGRNGPKIPDLID